MRTKLLFVLLVAIIAFGCTTEPASVNIEPKGKLFIIGGGKRPVSMVKEMIRFSGTDTAGYIVVLPMASSEPDTSGYYGKKQFTELGVKEVVVMNIQNAEICPDPRLDSLANAAMIYITGGDQMKFMDLVLNTVVYHAIHAAFNNGTVIAGSSAGAAVMSKKMITGNEFKHPEYTGDFMTIEANNIEIQKGLGLFKNAIVDQHFIKRMRMNRLISVAMENPGIYCYGIDESTALIVEGNAAHVFGESQVIRIVSPAGARTNDKDLLGVRGLEIDVLLPGDTISL